MAEVAEKAQTQSSKKEPLLKLQRLSHGTVEVNDIDQARRFYTEVLGMEVVQTSARSLMLLTVLGLWT